MLKKIKDNLALLVTAITLVGAIGSGVQSLNAVLNTLTGIDDRMNDIEYRFDELERSTMVASDIATLYEKIQQLENDGYALQQYKDKIISLETMTWNLEQKVFELENEFKSISMSDEVTISQWEFDQLKTDVVVNIAEINNIKADLWQIDDLKTRMAWIEANTHGH